MNVFSGNFSLVSKQVDLGKIKDRPQLEKLATNIGCGEIKLEVVKYQVVCVYIERVSLVKE